MMGKNIQSVYLKPGEIYIGEKPSVVSTVLGSCVSITMYSRRFAIGAICHGTLPVFNKSKAEMLNWPADICFKYVDSSIYFMLDKLKKFGIKSDEIEIKLFGGSDMFSSRSENSLTIGYQNIQSALKVIKEENLKLLVSDLGGKRGRKIFFYTHTGEVLLKRLKEGEKV